MSETKNLRLFKHNEPLETNENKFDIDLALNQNWDKIEEFADMVNDKVIELEDKDEEQDFNLQELQNEIKKDRENMINLEVEGQSIHIEDSSDLEGQLEVLGNAEQKTVKGIQLLERTNKGVSGWLFVTNPEGKGIMKEVNYLGTKAAEFSVSEALSSWKYMLRSLNLSKFKNNTAYTIQFDCLTNYDEKDLGISIMESNGTNKFIGFPKKQVNNTKTRIKVVATSNNVPLKNQILYIHPSGIGTVGRTLTITNLILVEGDYSNKDLEWEEYTNLEGMPSINYPSEIRAVGDNINLLENTAKTQIINGVEFTVNPDKTIKMNGTATSNTSLDITGNFAITEQSIFSGMCDGYGYNKMLIQIQGTDYNVNIPNSTLQVLQPKDNVKVRIYIYAGTSINNAIIRPKIEKGTVATSYSNFGQGSVEIKKQNKNLFDILKYPFTNKVAYAPTGEINYWTGYCGITEYFPVEENSNYIFSNDLNKPITYGLMFYNKNKEFISGIVENTTKFITPKNCKYIRFSIRSDTIPNKVQIEHGDKATEIVEHQEETKILPIQKPMLEGDYFIKEADGWKEVHGWKEIILNGQENTWQLYTSGTRRFGLDLSKDLPKKETGKYATGYCTHFKVATTMNIDLTMFLQLETDHFYIGIVDKNSKWTDVNALKSELQRLYNAGTPIILYYKVEIPTKLPCTPEQIEILDELDNFQTYKPVTNTTTDSIAKLRLKYIADTKTYVDNAVNNKVNNLEQQVSVISELLSTTKTSSVLLDNLQSDIESEVL